MAGRTKASQTGQASQTAQPPPDPGPDPQAATPAGDNPPADTAAASTTQAAPPAPQTKPDHAAATQVDGAAAASSEGDVQEQRAVAPGENPDTTRLDSHLDAPSTTAPGDGPADTTDPTEMASSAVPDKAAAAAAGHGTVNAVVKTGEGPATPKPEGERVETYEATRPDGVKVKVTHDLDTGTTAVKPLDVASD